MIVFCIVINWVQFRLPKTDCTVSDFEDGKKGIFEKCSKEEEFFQSSDRRTLEYAEREVYHFPRDRRNDRVVLSQKSFAEAHPLEPTQCEKCIATEITNVSNGDRYVFSFASHPHGMS